MKVFKNNREFAKELCRMDEEGPEIKGLNIAQCMTLAIEIIKTYLDFKGLAKDKQLRKKSSEIARRVEAKIKEGKSKDLEPLQVVKVKNLVLKISRSRNTFEKSLRLIKNS